MTTLQPFSHGPLQVSDNRRFLQHADGTPFFYLADTAWELFHRLNLADAKRYYDDRSRRGFNVIQACLLAELDGLHTPNRLGHLPLVDDDPCRPNEAYFQHADALLRLAEERGLYIAMLPTWGDKVGPRLHFGFGPVIFTPENAYTYGLFLGKRYRDFDNIIWVIGGDRNPCDHLDVWRALAAGVRQGDENRHLMTFHPAGMQSSGSDVHDEPWLDFNMIQSGHHLRDGDNYHMVERDYRRQPSKPVIDAEPRYEDLPINLHPENDWFSAYDVRQAAYWAVFAGACGHTYGCHPIWQMHMPGWIEPSGFTQRYWYDALDMPAARQMIQLRRLIESRPYFERVPDQSVIAGLAGKGGEHARACRAADGRYLFVYLPTGKPVSIDTRSMSGDCMAAWWYNPTNGEARRQGIYQRKPLIEFIPPSTGRDCDWVLVLDDAACGYPAPGALPDGSVSGQSQSADLS
jgi:hypothetical protein